MITTTSFTREWMMDHCRQRPGLDPSILEKMILALTLVERLVETGLPFTFKGGTCLVLVLGQARRFSVDVDLVTQAELAAIEAALTGRQWNYQQLREATADMGSRMFEVENERTYQQLWMFQRVEYIKGKGCLQIQLAAPIRPFLFNLKENFTSYQLHSALKLSSKYAKHIYQLVSQWKDKASTRTYPLDEFKQMLHLKDPKGKEPELFQNISQLKARVLDIAVRQVSEHTDLKIDYQLLKKGRAYDAVRFTIARQQPQQLPIPFEQPAEDARAYAARQSLDMLGITQPQLVATILGDPKHLDQLFKFTYQLKTDKVKATKNPGGLFLKICGLR